MYMVDILKAQYIDTIEVVNGNITPKEGDLPEMTLCNLKDTTTILVQTDSVPYTASKLSLSWLFIDKGTTRVEGLKGNWLQQSGTPISNEIAAFNQRMDETEDEAAVVELHRTAVGEPGVHGRLRELLREHIQYFIPYIFDRIHSLPRSKNRLFLTLSLYQKSVPFSRKLKN